MSIPMASGRMHHGSGGRSTVSFGDDSLDYMSVTKISQTSIRKRPFAQEAIANRVHQSTPGGNSSIVFGDNPIDYTSTSANAFAQHAGQKRRKSEALLEVVGNSSAESSTAPAEVKGPSGKGVQQKPHLTSSISFDAHSTSDVKFPFRKVRRIGNWPLPHMKSSITFGMQPEHSAQLMLPILEQRWTGSSLFLLGGVFAFITTKVALVGFKKMFRIRKVIPGLKLPLIHT
eukprot:gnl/MRDRNA2_/MRDRNA2_28735_c0_seq1.p1 gnl/MRDRNA2_/MRDRNA2_28735_c0~~gnl/MRDRNA2_/MRDRNA2_28735_c0_seq1.p1  ORF type:complete len:230 (+),score=40.70 gnl/MRDRNA2_/MRDRNA2_28735_c0_seq1:92-781(+)